MNGVEWMVVYAFVRFHLHSMILHHKIRNDRFSSPRFWQDWFTIRVKHGKWTEFQHWLQSTPNIEISESVDSKPGAVVVPWMEIYNPNAFIIWSAQAKPLRHDSHWCRYFNKCYDTRWLSIRWQGFHNVWWWNVCCSGNSKCRPCWCIWCFLPEFGADLYRNISFKSQITQPELIRRELYRRVVVRAKFTFY